MSFFTIENPHNNSSVESTHNLDEVLVYSKHLRIHGDNIVECERTLDLIKKAYCGNLVLLNSPLFKPTYQLITDKGAYLIDLLSGHGRWGVDVASVLQKNGGILHEGADSYVTEVNAGKETVVFALEYCSALPAGNNAWQRSGRALSSVLAGVPYLYFAEIGGSELDESREVKAPRFPNPVVPFSYLMTSQKYDSLCVPVYKTHPSITDDLYTKFKGVIGVDEGIKIIKCLIEGGDMMAATKKLVEKDLQLVKLLSNDRRSVDTLKGNQWDQLLAANNPEVWLSDNTKELTWVKKMSEKVCVSTSFKKLLSTVKGYNCRTIGGKDLPICIIPAEKVAEFVGFLEGLYPKINFSIDIRKPLTLVWITGFKPRGDDSRPDRGLTPLARMVVGPEAEIMAIISGPAKDSTWSQMKSSPFKLRKENGLWQSVFNLSNHVLIDSATAKEPMYFHEDCVLSKNPSPIVFDLANNPSNFSEDDTDCAIHQIFAHKNQFGIMEGLCNPPGGDWSGISYFNKTVEYRWTSLPRVSPIGGKRPDHVIQIAMPDRNILFSIEFKGKGNDLEENIGDHLTDYMRDLFNTFPTAYRMLEADWRSMGTLTPFLEPYSLYSIGAFLYKDPAELEFHRKRGQLDAVLAFDLGAQTIVHVKDSTPGAIVTRVLEKAQSVMTGFKIEIH